MKEDTVKVKEKDSNYKHAIDDVLEFIRFKKLLSSHDSTEDSYNQALDDMARVLVKGKE